MVLREDQVGSFPGDIYIKSRRFKPIDKVVLRHSKPELLCLGIPILPYMYDV